jgi:hypothetical protein
MISYELCQFIEGRHPDYRPRVIPNDPKFTVKCNLCGKFPTLYGQGLNSYFNIFFACSEECFNMILFKFLDDPTWRIKEKDYYLAP